MLEKKLDFQLKNKLNFIDTTYKRFNIVHKITIFFFVGIFSLMFSEYEYKQKKIETLKQMINEKFDKDFNVYQQSILIVKEKKHTEQMISKIQELLYEKNQNIESLNKIIDEFEDIRERFVWTIIIFSVLSVFYFTILYRQVTATQFEIEVIEKKLLNLKNKKQYNKVDRDFL